MAIKRVAFGIIDAAPAKIGGGLGLFATLAVAAYPIEARSWADWLMTPEQIRVIALVLAAIFALYWVAWFWLRPKPNSVEPPPDFLVDVGFAQDSNIRVRTTAPITRALRSGRATRTTFDLEQTSLPKTKAADFKWLSEQIAEGVFHHWIRLNFTVPARVRLAVSDPAASGFDVVDLDNNLIASNHTNPSGGVEISEPVSSIGVRVRTSSSEPPSASEIEAWLIE